MLNSLLLASTLILKAISTPIVGGTEVGSNHVYPWMGMQQSNASWVSNDGSFHQSCGGSMIRENVLVTAAHCHVIITNLNQLKVFSHVYDSDKVVEEQAIEFKVVKIIKHEKFDGVGSNPPNAFDISLYILEQVSNPSNRKVETIEVASFDPNTINDQGPIKTIGWGAMTDISVNANQSKTLRETELQLVTLDYCTEIYKQYYTFDKVGPEFLCANDGNVGLRSICYGDSGGPSFTIENNKPILQGISSWVEGYCEAASIKSVPVLYVRASYFKNWIEEKLALEGL
ncbi:hypothetical protein HK099_000144 [Clydaea vesicula]|uniref:Peptidase S1 domain-containing protein n=1 Tax=Clydaea vesicula TaxID=447962 RepID=A0AAD5TVE9_9FUNG|nr:hypothetical protein HK099_000144 [Clydaea vesicula]KAJ3377512.1 hypothetical protein HDU92_008204 [Lobulomyces angularis]